MALLLLFVALLAFAIGVIYSEMPLKKEQEEREALYLLRRIADRLDIIDCDIRNLKPRLYRIAITIKGDSPVAQFNINVGDTKTATVQGFDQFGQPFAIDFSANPASWASSDASILSSSPLGDSSQDSVQGLAAGAASLSVNVAGFADSVDFSVAAIVPVPVLSSVKITVA